MFKRAYNAFWSWYERHQTLNTAIAAVLFTGQLVHLWWLSSDVVAMRLFNAGFFPLDGAWQTILVLVDYTEIPAIIAASLVYINQFRSGSRLRAAAFLLLLNSQWLHMFWITDEFVVSAFTETHTAILPAWLAWLAIAIDYLELPVIYDTVKRAIRMALASSGDHAA